jgi:hypothetical protein
LKNIYFRKKTINIKTPKNNHNTKRIRFFAPLELLRVGEKAAFNSENARNWLERFCNV